MHWINLSLRGTLAGAILTALSVIAMAGEPKWGRLEGQFVFDGIAPQPRPIKVFGADKAPGADDLVDESLVVDPKTNGIANICVWLRTLRQQPVQVHPSFQKNAKAEIVLTMKGQRPDPHVLYLRAGQTLLSQNKDPFGHNTRIEVINNATSGDLLPTGRDMRRTFNFSETMPTKIACAIHPWMSGWLIIKDHPYGAVSKSDGRFVIDNLPVGDWQFQVWHETAGFVKQVTRGGSMVGWPTGRPTFTIAEGTNQLGIIKLSPQIFNPQ